MLLVWLACFLFMSFLCILSGIQDYKKFSCEKPTVVTGTIIRNEAAQLYVRPGRRISGPGKDVTVYTAIYEYEYHGTRELRDIASSKHQKELGKTKTLYIYDDGTILFKRVPLFNAKVNIGIFVTVFSSCLTWFLW